MRFLFFAEWIISSESDVLDFTVHLVYVRTSYNWIINIIVQNYCTYSVRAYIIQLND